MINTLGGGLVTSPSTALSALSEKPQAKPAQASATPAPFWQVRGVIDNSTVQFGPLFQMTIQGNTGQGAGTYALAELDADTNIVFVRFFTPESPATETADQDQKRPMGFSQAIPVNAGVASIGVFDPTGLEIGSITMGGVAPTVNITSPGAGFTGTGTKSVSWTIQNLTGNTSYSKVLYSADMGKTWSGIGDLQKTTTMPVDFDKLPGSNTALIQVLVSDGINTGSATSAAFTVSRKTPVVQIESPAPNASQPAADPVYLSGSAYNPDVGVLTGSALTWSSNLQGSLGSGSPLSVHLQPGNHIIQLTANDSEGNIVSTSVNVTIGGQAPVVGVQPAPQNTAPTTCENVTVSAQPGATGAPLARAEVSLDGGATYSAINLGVLPFTFLAPGKGYMHVVARAYDTSGQASAKDVNFFTSAVCHQAKCNVTNNFGVDVRDLQQMINEATGVSTPSDDLNGDGVVNIVDIQMEANVALGGPCGA